MYIQQFDLSNKNMQFFEGQFVYIQGQNNWRSF